MENVLSLIVCGSNSPTMKLPFMMCKVRLWCSGFMKWLTRRVVQVGVMYMTLLELLQHYI